MGNTLHITSFTVTKSNPSGNTVRFTITDTANQLTTTKMIRSVLGDAIDQWIVLERADLDTNADTDVKGSDEYSDSSSGGIGDGFSQFDFNYGSKYAEVGLTALTSISTSGTLTATSPFADVA